MNGSQLISYPKYGSFRILTTNKTLKLRAETFLKKEPTTLEWLQSLEDDSMLIDVGANIGIYSIPSALFHVKKVIALEPGILNFNMLLKNMELNNISSNEIEALPLAVSTKHAGRSTKIYLTREEAGESCHQIGKNQDHLLNENPIPRKSRSVYCVSLSSVVKQIDEYHNGPLHIKIDVNGIEEDVCQSLFDDKLINRISSLQIELNYSLASHKQLVKKLASAGYYYSKDQANRSIRKFGDFKGFAEVVFRRNFAQSCVTKLPAMFVNTLGKNYYAVDSFDELSASAKSYLKLFDSIPIPLSRQPATYAFKNAFDPYACAHLFHQISKLIIKEGGKISKFGDANGQQSGNQLRYIIEFSKIRDVSPQYVSEPIEQATSKRFVCKIADVVKHAAQFIYPRKYLAESYADPQNKKLKDTHIVCRIRHFLDVCGYSLDIHNDSDDTLCAIVVPLIPYTTSTSIATGGYFDRSFSRELDENNAVVSDFKQNTLVDAQSSPNTYVEYRRACKDEQFSPQVPSTLQQSSLNPGEIFVIPNMKSFIFGDNQVNSELKIVKQLLRTIGHGVLPAVKEPYRPLLLIDYLLANPSNIPGSSDREIIVDLGSTFMYCTK